MLETYKSDNPEIAGRQVEIHNYTVLSETILLGWEIQVASSKQRPLILFKAEDWEGRRPRFAVTALHVDDLRRVLQDLSKIQLHARDRLATLAYEEPLWIDGGVPEIAAHDTESRKLWAELSK